MNDLSASQEKLLYIVSLYDSIRSLFLEIIMFETNIFPTSTLHPVLKVIRGGTTSRTWIETSQKGKAEIEELLILRYLQRMKTFDSHDGTTVATLSLSKVGTAKLSQLSLSNEQKDSIDQILFPPLPFRISRNVNRKNSTNLLRVRMKQQQDDDDNTNHCTSFELFNRYSIRVSAITLSVDLSNTMPMFSWQPFCPREQHPAARRRLKNQRVVESPLPHAAATKTQKRKKRKKDEKEEEEEEFQLDTVTTVLAEWIPQGANEMSRLCLRLDVAATRCQKTKTFITNRRTTGFNFLEENNNNDDHDHGMTNVHTCNISSYDKHHSRFVNLTATSWCTFGVSLSESGAVLSG